MVDAPARSTVEQVLARRGQGTRLRPARPPRGEVRRFARAASNELWQIDGSQHRLADGTAYWVVDLIDDHSRFCPAIRVGAALTGRLAWDAFRLAVGEHGLPAGLLSDNGLCFTGRLHGKVVAFERQVNAAGTRMHHSRPFHPQTCGKVERLHQTARGWLARRDPPRTLEEAQTLFDAFRRHYNHDRPHEALDGAAPGDRYQPSTPVELPVIEIEPADAYPTGCLRRKVGIGGQFGYQRRTFYLGDRWAGITIGLVRSGAQLHVYYGSALIDTFLVGTINNQSR